MGPNIKVSLVQCDSEVRPFLIAFHRLMNRTVLISPSGKLNQGCKSMSSNHMAHVKTGIVRHKQEQTTLFQIQTETNKQKIRIVLHLTQVDWSETRNLPIQATVHVGTKQTAAENASRQFQAEDSSRSQPTPTPDGQDACAHLALTQARSTSYQTTTNTN